MISYMHTRCTPNIQNVHTLYNTHNYTIYISISGGERKVQKKERKKSTKKSTKKRKKGRKTQHTMNMFEGFHCGSPIATGFLYYYYQHPVRIVGISGWRLHLVNVNTDVTKF